MASITDVLAGLKSTSAWQEKVCTNLLALVFKKPPVIDPLSREVRKS